MNEEKFIENGKIAVALRAGRAAIGWSQDEFATLMGVAKSTIARIETLEMAAKAEFVNKAMRLFRDAGVVLDLYEENTLPLIVSKKAVLNAIARLQDESLRRSDRAKVRELKTLFEAQNTELSKNMQSFGKQLREHELARNTSESKKP